MIKGKVTSQDIYRRELIVHLLRYLYLELFNAYQKEATLKTDRKDIRKEELANKFFELIMKHFKENKDVAFYADKLCLSPKYLSAVSKSICGYTVQELVFKAIIRKSISLLKNTQQDIQEISNAFGFPNASYFGTFFKKQVGMSPQQYRKSL